MAPFWPRHSPNFLQVRRAIRAIDNDQPVVVGLSGGADSLALLAGCVAEGLQPHAVVVDHGLQEGSADVARRAKETAERLGAQATVVKVSVGKGNVEAKAREARYAALFTAAGCGRVWVAHTANDQAETFLMGALRGHPTGMLTADAHIVRPLLSVQRDVTEGACHELGLDYWDDPMNVNTDFLRVALRTQILPQLGELTRADAIANLARAGANAAADNQMLAALAPTPTNDELEVADLKDLPEPLLRRTIIGFLHHHDLTVSAAIVDAITALITHWRGQGGVACGGNTHNRLEVARINGKLLVVATPQA